MLVALTFPVTLNTLDPVSNTERLEPTSKSFCGFVFAIPTFDSVTKPVVAFVNCMVLLVVFPLSDTDCKSVTRPVK